ncbi:MAG: tetratricopeptide repeat protein [Owenweeksia sp.]
MRKWMTLAAIILGFALHAQNPASDFEKANAAYKEEKYSEALNLYKSIREQGYESAELYYNMGNTYFKLGQTAPSILHYERAARLAPYDDDIQQNLKIANQGVIDRFEAMPKPLVRTAYLGILQLFSPNGWAWAALIFFTILAIGMALYLFTAARRPGFILGFFGLLLGILALALAFAHESYDRSHKPAIVMTPSSYVKTAPSATAEDAFILHEGTKAQVTDYLEGWKKIRLPDGKVGWIEAADITEV